MLVVLGSCKNGVDKTANQSKEPGTLKAIESELFELHKAEDEKAVLILYPGAGTTSVETKQEFDILEKAEANNITVLLMNFTNHLWLTQQDCKKLTKVLEGAFEEHRLNRDKIYIGGMSVGGTVAVSLSDYLISVTSDLTPEGVFIVDSPIDLYALYESACKDMAREDFTDERLAEPRFIMSYFEKEFGTQDSLVENIKKVSPFVYKLKINSVRELRETKLRFYTEPDSLWWRENRNTDFENTNSYVIQQISTQLDSAGWDKYELIETQGKGFRANGERHPHSWSIVDVDDLITWILE